MSKFFNLSISALSDMQARMVERGLLQTKEGPNKILRKTTPNFYNVAYLDEQEVNSIPDPDEEGVRKPNTSPEEGVRFPNAGVRKPNANRSETEHINKVSKPLTEIEGEPGLGNFSPPKDNHPEPVSDPESYGSGRELYDSPQFLEYSHELEKLLRKVDKKLRACIMESDVGREDFIETFVKWCFDSGKTFSGTSGLDKLLESHVGFLKNGGKEILEPDMREFEMKVDAAIQYAIKFWRTTDPYGNSYEKFLASADMNYRSEADALKTLLTRRKINFDDLRLILKVTGRSKGGMNVYTPSFQYRWSHYLQNPDELTKAVAHLREMENNFQKNRQKVLA